MLSFFDYFVIGFYFLFMIGLGVVFSRYAGNTSDYFRGGGRMPWWLTGASAFMAGFSAWTFTGAASKAYEDGLIIYFVYLGNAVGYLLGFFVFASLFRRLRVISSIEAVRQRFGRVNEQVITWCQLPLGVLYAGLWLNGLGVFLSAILQIDLTWVILVTGIVVVLVSFTAGSWGVMASDFIQTLILIPISIVAMVYALKLADPARIIHEFPADSLVLGSNLNYPLLAVLWCVAVVLKNGVLANNIQTSSRYLAAKDEHHARKAALLAMILFLAGPIVWFIPPMVSAVIYPDLSAMFPTLARPSEAAFLAIPMQYFPAGLLGLLVCALIAATMSSMDTGLNMNAGFFVRNFYLGLIRPRAADKELMVVSKIITLVFGAIIIGCALMFASLKDFGLFDLMLLFGGLIAFPVGLPMFWGLFFRRGPDWVCWSTIVLCFGISLLCKFWFTPEWLCATFNLEPVFTARESADYYIVVAVFLNAIVGSGWFIAASLIFRNAPVSESRQRAIKIFDANLKTPIRIAPEVNDIDLGVSENPERGDPTVRMMFRLCMIYGGFISLLCLIPNPVGGRISFLFCGGVLLTIGFLLRKASIHNV